MKIVCESCGAKYSIADEKVAGKVFKIRCKRCSEVIMVRGDQESQPAQDAAAVSAAAPDEIWHVVVNGEQQGPHTPMQLGELLTNGTLDWDAYVWTEGFDNWVPMRDVEDLVAQITGGGQSAASAQTTAAGGFHAAAGQTAAVSEAYAAQPSMGADPFAEPAPSGEAGHDAGPNLFGNGAAPPGGGSPFAAGGVIASSPSPRAEEEQVMTGTRNENSVLFSLKNLQALATGSNAPSAAPPSPSSGQAGFASGEGSGLIDIRALASATGIGESERKDNGGDKDELLAMGGQGAAFGTLGSPMLAPSSDEREGGNKMLIMAGIIGISVVMAGGLVAFAMLRTPDAQTPEPPGLAPTPEPAPVAAAPTPTPQPEEPLSEGEKAAQAAAKEADESEQDTGGDSSEERAAADRRRRPGAGDRRERPARSAPDEKEPAVAAKPEPAPEKPKPRGGSSSLDELLAGALDSPGPKKSAKSAPAPDANLPPKPGRKDVVEAMNSVKGAVSACGKGASGVAFANVTVSGATGRVKSVQVEGQQGAVGSCIARAVRKARFPKFKANTFEVKYPFRL